MYPHERSLVRLLAEKPFAIVGVNSDESLDEIREVVGKKNISWRSFWNGPEGTRGPISTKWGVGSWPTTYLLDKDGVIRYKNVRGASLDSAIETLMVEMGQDVKLSGIDHEAEDASEMSDVKMSAVKNSSKEQDDNTASIGIAEKPKPQLIETKRIWDAAPHNAFTDLVRWNEKFYCAFREGKGHAGDDGKLRIIASINGEKWDSAGLLSMDEYDLRDAALSVMPDGRLMVLGGAQQVRDGKDLTGTFVSFSKDGSEFSPPKMVIPLGRWLWRVTWHGDTAYGVSYGTHDNRPTSALHKTKDGIHYETVTDELLGEGGWPTEARVRFAENGMCYCLHRRSGDQGNSAYLGSAKAPYTDWHWHDLGARLGGPNFLQLPNGTWIGAGRLYDGGERTELIQIDVASGKMSPLLRLPSGGDTSYPGMVWHDNTLWVSYYASHEGKTNVYLSKVRFPDVPNTTKTNSQ